jgi:hypothetical protein
MPSLRPKWLNSRAVALSALCAIAACSLSGCATHRVLRKSTVAVNATLSDIYYEQVLNNVARFEANPDSMPSFAMVTAGTVNIEDSHTGGFNPTYSPTLTRAMQGGGALPILSMLFQTSASRSVTENWSTTPVTDSDNIRRMRCAFQLLVGSEESECGKCKARLEGFFLGGTESFECALPRGWYQAGCKDDVPDNACHVAHYCDIYVWVTAAGMDGLSRFTITIMDIATGEIHAPQRSVVRKYKGLPEPENLETTEVTATETDLEALKKVGGFGVDRTRLDAPTFNRGLFFVPR